jgi:predicted DsbA family dithiol-disulfide isomerase/uncharacterized membrane protein
MKPSVVASRPEVEEIGSARPLGVWLLVAMLFVAFGGLLAATVLSAGHILKLPVPCGTSSGCATVASHPSSVFLGVPIAFFGVAAYVAIIFLLIGAPRRSWASPALVAITGAGTLVSAGLLIYAHVIIHATCTWCLASGAAMAVLFPLALYLWHIRDGLKPVPPGMLWRLAIITALAIGAEVWFMERSVSAPPIPAEKLATVPVAELLNDRNSRGRPDAPVKILIFSDLSCSVCRAVHQPLLDYQTAHPDDVEVIFRHRPLSGIRGHETSQTAAQLSEIAADGGKFWQFVEKLYREPHQLDHAGYLRLMRDLGFQSSRVEAILADAHAPPTDRVRRDAALAERLGVHSTPTFVLIIGHNPPVSANHRSLVRILNSRAVQALFAHEGEPGEPPR